MPLEEAGALYFFRIRSCTSKSQKTTKKIVTKEEETVHTQTYVMPFSGGRTNTIVTRRDSTPVDWEEIDTYSSQYYDSSGNFCGTSTRTENYDRWRTEKHSSWRTDYYNSNGNYCGASHSQSYGQVSNYYDSNGKSCGTSKGNAQESTYYDSDGCSCGTAIRDGGTTTYFTPQQMAEREEQERAERDERERYERAMAEYKRTQAREAREKAYREEQEKTERERAARERAEQATHLIHHNDVVKEQVRLLTDKSTHVRHQAQKELLRLSVDKRDFGYNKEGRIGFRVQMIHEALPIINAMIKVITDMSTDSGPSSQVQTEELWNSLTLFGKLDFRGIVRDIVLEKKVIPFLVKMREVYVEKDSNRNSVLGENIAIELRKMRRDHDSSAHGERSVYGDTLTSAIVAIAEQEKVERIGAARENTSIPKLEKYYLSQAGFFNASSKIFLGNNRDVIFQTLENRARSNPRGASEKTLKKFGLK